MHREADGSCCGWAVPRRWGRETSVLDAGEAPTRRRLPAFAVSASTLKQQLKRQLRKSVQTGRSCMLLESDSLLLSGYKTALVVLAAFCAPVLCLAGRNAATLKQV
eukprot:1974766-Pleurochrysis_carterae.AAC.6